jgi:preprotein translocase subunit SecF
MYSSTNRAFAASFLMRILMVFICLLGSSLAAQQTDVNKIDDDFEILIGESNDFKEYKVIKKTDLRNLRKATNDNVTLLKDSISTLGAKLLSKQKTIDELQASLLVTKADLEETTLEKSSIEILGVQTSKSNYNLIVWSIITALLIALVVILMRFKSSYAITRESRQQLLITEEELEELRKRSIEKEQKLGRQLQDERNKLAKLKSE